MLDLCYCGSAVEHHLGKTKTALFNHSISPQKSFKNSICWCGSAVEHCLGKEFWGKIYNLIFPNFMEQQLMLT